MIEKEDDKKSNVQFRKKQKEKEDTLLTHWKGWLKKDNEETIMNQTGDVIVPYTWKWLPRKVVDNSFVLSFPLWKKNDAN